MAIQLEANYSKKLRLPNSSSHQYAVTLRVEVLDPTQVGPESARLYDLLQSCVDESLQKPGRRWGQPLTMDIRGCFTMQNAFLQRPLRSTASKAHRDFA